MTDRNDSGSALEAFTVEETTAIARSALSRMSAPQGTVFCVASSCAAALATGNQVNELSNRDNFQMHARVDFEGRRAEGRTSRCDSDGIAAFIRDLEKMAKQSQPQKSDETILAPPRAFTDPVLYFESTAQAGSPQLQCDVLRRAVDVSKEAELVGAVDLTATARLMVVGNTAGFLGNTRSTFAEFSVLTKTPDGKASGWARDQHEDFAKLDPVATTARAIALCRRSAKPVAVEPGRYTVILEPEAVADLLDMTNRRTGQMSAQEADEGRNVYSKQGGGNKIGMKMLDERVSIFTDPTDPLLPFSPLNTNGMLFERTGWFERGELKNLSYFPRYAMLRSRTPLWHPEKGHLQIAGPTQSLDEMIATTKRGIWIHRLWNLWVDSYRTMLMTGTTRDGTFLIENGKVSKAVKNFRFNESLFFILNKIEAFGPSVRAAERYAVPRLKVRDFELSSLTDAV